MSGFAQFLLAQSITSGNAHLDEAGLMQRNSKINATFQFGNREQKLSKSNVAWPCQGAK